MMTAILSAGACSRRSSSVDGVEVELIGFGHQGCERTIPLSYRAVRAVTKTIQSWLSLPSRIEITNDHAEHLRRRARVARQHDHVAVKRASLVEAVAVVERDRRQARA